MTPQLYSRRNAAVRAAVAAMGRLAAEGSHFEIKRQQQPNGMYRYYSVPVALTKPDIPRTRTI